MRLLGILFLNIIFGVLFVYIGENSLNDFLSNFLKNQILPISATILGFNIASIIFLLGQITNLELTHKIDLSSTKKEIKDNIYFMGITFILILFFLLIKPICPIKDYFIYNSVIMTLFFIMLYSLYEILEGAFDIIPRNK